MGDAVLLNVVLYLPLLGIALIVAMPDGHDDRIRANSFGVMLAQFVITAMLYMRFDPNIAGLQFETRLAWMADWGVYYHIALDGYNVLLVLLTAFLGPLVVAGAFSAIQKDVKLRLSKGEKRNAKRMAMVASVYTIAPVVRTAEDIVRGLTGVGVADEAATPKVPRPRPEHKRVWASLEKSPEQVIEEAFREAVRRDPRGEKKWVALVDGNETQLRLLHQVAERVGTVVTIVLDIVQRGPIPVGGSAGVSRGGQCRAGVVGG